MALALDAETSGLEDDAAVHVVSFCDTRSFDCFSFSAHTHSNNTHLLHALDMCDRYSSRLVSFNGSGFDFRMIAANVEEAEDKRRAARHALKSYDMMLDFACSKGYFSSLDSFADASFGETKTGTGDGAVEDWAARRYDKVIAYCEADAALTAKVYNFGCNEGRLMRKTKSGGKVQAWALPISGFRTAIDAIKEYRADPPDVSWMDDPPDMRNNIKWAVALLT